MVTKIYYKLPYLPELIDSCIWENCYSCRCKITGQIDFSSRLEM